ncbi:hypothetical protein conserved [Leishmania donovani]|uniref:Hypothetical_protein_conserved n=1 Tax=Leishmania donovani TaxID=5661 RepID=A0A3S7X1P3_LEIDO|nr:hypothetical protein LdCL_280026700 [Leishmania donovani]TPP40425.1 hypothetical protein CGC20_13050 [Leishmania donovani]CAJ1990359.1 hypothetical protein conserved [Leishmania donovani]VDZ46215.1 hypothetical_protein_conserved [Leishmania donovani]
MASSSPQVKMDSAIRATDEYAAAFDLEVWKAQQQLRYQAQLRQAKERLERRLHKEARESEKKKMAELERLRQELETMGHRLQVASETLEKRTAQLDAREAAFNVKRVKVAEQHEAYVARAEEQARRTREEAQLAQSSLQARLQEKDRIILQLQERVSSAQQEYDLLRRRATRYLSEQNDTDGQRLREQECALSLSQTQLAEAQRQLREKSADVARLAESQASLEQQLHELKRQLSIVMRKYHRLREECQAREWERLRKEQGALSPTKRRQSLHAHRLQQPQQPLSAPFLPSGFIKGDASTTAGNIASGVAERDDFYAMLTELKQEVAAGLAAVNRTSRPGPHPFTIVERPAGTLHSTVHDTSCHSHASPQARTCATSITAGESAGDPTTGVPSRQDTTLETSSVSAVSCNLQRKSPPHAQRRPQVGDSGAETSVVVDMGDTSIDSAYPLIDLPPWTTSMIADEEDGVASLPSVRASTLPPLAPAQRGLEEALPDTAYPPHISPTPEEFVLARDAPLDDTSSAAKSAAARRDMETFVQQLKMNREKLLETGVYSEDDQVVKEMGEKIRMYEQYLAQQRQ